MDHIPPFMAGQGMSGVSGLAIAGQPPAGLPPGYAAWLAAVQGAGASPTTTKKNAIKDFFAGLDDDGLWAEWTGTASFLYISAGTNDFDTADLQYAEAVVNLISPGTFDAVVNNQSNAGLDTPGISGDGVMYWSTGLNIQNHVGAARFGNFSLGAAITGPVNASATTPLGVEFGWCPTPRYVDNNFYTSHNNQLQSVANASAASALFMASSKSGTVKQYKNATEVASVALGAQYTPNFEVICFGRTSGAGAPSALTLRRLGALFALPGMTGVQVTAFYNRLKTLLAAFGATI